MSNVIRGNFNALVSAGVARILTIGDEIEHPYVSGRALAACLKRWPVNMVGCVATPRSQGDTGWPLSFSSYAGDAHMTARVGPASTGLRPGDTFTDSTTGHNLMMAKTAELSGDLTNFGVASQSTFYNSNAYQSDWDSGKSLKATVVARGHTNAPDQWRITTQQRNAVTQTESTQVQIPLSDNNGVIFKTTATWSRLTGAVYAQMFYVQVWNETELSGWHADIVSLGVQDNAPTTGIFWGYAGDIGFTTKTHLAAGESINPGGFGAFTAYYSDAAIDAQLSAFAYNVFRIRIGQTRAADEGSGGTIGNYQTNVQAIITRIRARCTAAGITPIFILDSQYDAASDNTRYVLMSEALRAIALANPDVEFFDCRAEVQRQLGAWSTWQAANTSDGILPVAALSNLMADAEWAALTGPTTGSGGATSTRTRLQGRRSRSMDK